MTRAVDSAQAQRFLHILGEELRQARLSRGWTRWDLVTRLGSVIAESTLATYEQGTRPCTVARLWELGEVLGVPAAELYVRAHERMTGATRGLEIGLSAAAAAQFSRLAPLRAWSQVQLRTHPDTSRPTVTLDESALAQMATLCELATADFVDRLHRAGLVCLDPTLSAEQGDID